MLPALSSRAFVFFLTCGWLLLLCAAGQTPQARADTLKVEIDGVEGELRQTLADHLAAVQGKDSADFAASRIRAMHRRAPRILEEALEATGYYRAEVRPTLTTSGTTWTARYQVAPGSPVTVQSLSIELAGPAASDAAVLAAKAAFPLAIGDRLVHARWEEGKRALERLLADRGYFDARITKAEVEVSRRRAQASAVLAIDSGPRYVFGEVLWPQVALGPAFLSRYRHVAPGTPFLASEMLAFQSRLNDSNYFGNVSVEPRRDLATGLEVPIEVGLEMRPAQRYSIGAGFGTDTGPRGRASWLRPWVNERGHRAEAEVRISAVQSSVLGRYSMPSPKVWTDSVDLSTQLINEDTESKKSLKLVIGAAHLTTRHDWRESLGLDYEVESYDVADSNEIAGLLVPSARWSRTWADDPIHPKHGLRVNLGLRAAHEALLSSTSFAQVRLDAKYVQTLGRTRFLARTELGAVAAADFDKLPASERFFAGGDSSLRGFDYETLGPRNARGKVEGGRYLVLGSVEVERPVVGRWSAALFSDFGNAINDLTDPFALSVGGGIRWQSPIGPVRVDIANGISDPDFPWRLHIIVGPDL